MSEIWVCVFYAKGNFMHTGIHRQFDDFYNLCRLLAVLLEREDALPLYRLVRKYMR
jgi:hypothetical protein